MKFQRKESSVAEEEGWPEIIWLFIRLFLLVSFEVTKESINSLLHRKRRRKA